MAQVYAELLEKGYSGPYANFEDLNNRCNVVYSTDENDQIMGGMAFEYWTPGKEGFIHLNFVDPKFRGRGISHVSRKYYQILVKQRGGNKVSSTINVNNQASWNTAIKDGMQPVYYRMHKWL
jgi:RimJ/RimL family protein N-acetyltransferase